MSEELIREQDEELIEMVNRGKDTSAADAIVAGMSEAVGNASQARSNEPAKEVGHTPWGADHYQTHDYAIKCDVMAGRDAAKNPRKGIAALILRVLGCVLAALIFAGLILDVSWAPYVGGVGFVVFVVMCAIILDRYFCRRGR